MKYIKLYENFRSQEEVTGSEKIAELIQGYGEDNWEIQYVEKKEDKDTESDWYITPDWGPGEHKIAFRNIYPYEREMIQDKIIEVMDSIGRYFDIKYVAGYNIEKKRENDNRPGYYYPGGEVLAILKEKQ
jgi:hypothetical protein